MTSVAALAVERPFALNVKVHVKPQRREAFLAVIQQDAAQTVATEAGALQFTLGEDTSTPHVFYFHEQYRDEAGFEAHTKTPHFAAWQAFCDTQPFVTDPVVQKYQLSLGEGDDKNSEPTRTTKVPVDRQAYCLNVELCIQPEVRDAFLQVIANNQQGSRTTEAGCLQYDFGESITTPNAFYFHEQYKDQAGFDAHAVAPHFVAWEAFAATDPFTQPPVVSFYQSIPVVPSSADVTS
jgi:quinol monooxygenase YgiN